jgi:hypothetical protein
MEPLGTMCVVARDLFFDLGWGISAVLGETRDLIFFGAFLLQYKCTMQSYCKSFVVGKQPD